MGWAHLKRTRDGRGTGSRATDGVRGASKVEKNKKVRVGWRGRGRPETDHREEADSQVMMISLHWAKEAEPEKRQWRGTEFRRAKWVRIRNAILVQTSQMAAAGQVLDP